MRLPEEHSWHGDICGPGGPAAAGHAGDGRVGADQTEEVRSAMATVVLIIIIVIVVLLALGLWAAYNGLVKKRNRTQEAWSEIDVELKRRHDLIPNLVSAVQGYATHEQGTFEAVTKARASAISAGATGDPSQIAPAENALSGALRSLFAVAENYPQLRAVESFRQLQETLTATEDKIEFARRYYNTSARDYNIALQTFPRNLVAEQFGFKPAAFFATGEDDRAVPQVSFPGRGPGAAGPAPPGPLLAGGPGEPPPADGSREPLPGG
jgi:LemA protein